MNSLDQNSKNLLIGAKTNFDLIAKAESARILVVSDSHGHKERLSKILFNAGQDCDAFIFCGDGAYDVFFALEKAWIKNADQNSLPPLIALVRGNGDERFYRTTFGKKGFSVFQIPDNAIFTACGTTIFVTHGHLFSAYFETQEIAQSAKMCGAKIAIFGHTHKRFFSQPTTQKVALLNPGSIMHSRDEKNPSFAILTLSQKTKTPKISCDFFDAI